MSPKITKNASGIFLGVLLSLFLAAPALPHILWSHDVGGPHSRTVIDDINGDAYDDVVILDNNEQVRVLSGQDGSTQLWSHQISTAARYRRGLTTINDLDGDGVKDIILVLGTSGNGYGENHGDDDLYAVSGAAIPPGNRLLWGGAVRIGCGLNSPIILPDVNGDGKEDIFAKTSTPTCYGSGDAGFHVSGDDGALFWHFEIYAEGAIWDIYGRTASPDLNGDGRADIVVTGAGGSGGVETWKGGPVKGQIWRSLTGKWVLNPTVVPDVTGDGIPEIAVSLGPSPIELKLLNGSSGGVIWYQQFGNTSYIAGDLGDVDTDGYADLAVGLYYFNGSGWPSGTEYQVHAVSGNPGASPRILWSYDLIDKNSYVRAVDDLDGDGRKDVMVWGAMNKVMALSGLNGTVIYEESFSTGTGGIQIGEFSGTMDQDFLTSSGTEIFALSATVPPPTIGAFSPAVGTSGTTVTIHGTNFIGTEVKFGGTDAASFTVDSPTQITAEVGTGSSGKVTVTTDGGTATSDHDFTFIASAATISGRVTDSDEQPLASIHVDAFDNPCHGNWFGSVTDQNGDYAILVPPGTYYVRADASLSYQNYIMEWWNDDTGTPDCSLALGVIALAEQTTWNIDFALGAGGSVSGRVTDAQGNPIPNLHMNADSQACGGNWLGGIQTDANGDYRITGLPQGSVFIRTCANCTGLAYVDEWYDNVTTDCSQATPVPVVVSQDTPNINFSLDPGAIISGQVADSFEQPLEGIPIDVVDNTCNGNWYGTATHENGAYTVVVPEGTYYVRAYPGRTDQNYVMQWWDAQGGTLDCQLAVAVNPSMGQPAENVNFLLEPGASISGTVTDAEATPISDLSIDAFTEACGGYYLGDTLTDANGTYHMTGLPQGDVFIRACASCTGRMYVDEWYNDARDCNQAAPVPLIAGQETPNIDFSLAQSGSMAGRVISDLDEQPIEGAQICAWPFPGGAGQCAITGSDGRYNLTGVPQGYLRVQASADNYLTEYYDNSYDPNWATAVWVTQGQTTPDIDFSLGKNGSISGTIYQIDGTTPLPYACVAAYMHPCASTYHAGTHADGCGNYTLSDLPPGYYFVETKAACTQPYPYVDQWWTSGGGALFCDQAQPVTVASEENTPNINFSLSASGATYPGPSFSSAGVFSAHRADGSIGTTFFAFIHGPSVKDVVSLTATQSPAETPSNDAVTPGSFTLRLADTPFIQLGHFYTASVSSIVPDGTYTFTITDTLGRKATVVREFTYDSALPQVDAATMKVNGMGDLAYVGTATPTLTWDPVVWEGTPGYYQTFVFDYDGRAIWYSETTEGTTVQIPQGYLQPDTAYYWWVRTCDIPETGQRGQNRRYSGIRYFYTGTKDTPDLNNPGNQVLSYATPDNGWANWFGITQTRLAPWDIQRYTVTGPQGTVYNYNGGVYFLWHPMFYHCWSPGPAPTPGGNYTFHLEDLEAHTATLVKDFVYDPASPIPEATRLPADNAYLYTDTPTFSWTAPAVGEATDPTPYYYNLRIYDYNARIHWYSSPLITETSFTLPEDVVSSAPPGSYKWEVRAYTDPTRENGAFSSKRTVTIPPLSGFDYTLPTGTGDPLDYVIFTVPLYMGTGADLLKALEQVLGSYDPPTHWRIFGYDLTQSSNYMEINTAQFAAMNIEPGMAYWIISVFTDKAVLLEGAMAPQTTYYERKLHSNWNLFALPWPATSIDLGNIAVTDGTNTYPLVSAGNTLTLPYIWGFDREYVLLEDMADVVAAGEGFWIKVVADPSVTVKVLIPPDNNGGYFDVGSKSEVVLPSITTYEPPPPPPGGYPPMPDIQANGEDDMLRVPSGTPLSVSIALNPGNYAGQNADWWVGPIRPLSGIRMCIPRAGSPGSIWRLRSPCSN